MGPHSAAHCRKSLFADFHTYEHTLPSIFLNSASTVNHIFTLLIHVCSLFMKNESMSFFREMAIITLITVMELNWQIRGQKRLRWHRKKIRIKLTQDLIEKAFYFNRVRPNSVKPDENADVKGFLILSLRSNQGYRFLYYVIFL